ncbi:MAG TPA: 1,4-alpha-glucan branching protein GlgB [Candidatus Onthovivens sp.]|nr:1,4-alpha-glucan branching protein GlgB [Candidatus Onthovivens sp.]
MNEKLVNDFLNGQTIEAYNLFGAHFENRTIEVETLVPLKKDPSRKKKVKVLKEVSGVIFRLYAPLASDVSVIGDFNNWDSSVHKLKKVHDSGIFEIFIEGLSNYSFYKYKFRDCHGNYVDKIDPYEFFHEYRPGTCSRLFNIDGFIWHDRPFLNSRDRNFDKPMSVYEMHLGSWKGKVDNRNLSYEEIADYLIPYIKELGYTHIEIMPITQYPFDGSWGYQATGFFSVDSRYGNPFQLMSFVDRMHQAGIGVILDFAPVHFGIDPWALAQYDGSPMFEYGNEHMYSPWGSLQFDLGKDPVRSFLMSAMNYFLDYFHFDGIRVDAVSNIVYYSGNKNNGENTGATEFIKRLNGKIHLAHPDVMMIAEDSTDFPQVTKPTEWGGLGFDYKWDLGWMNDTLKYYALDPIYKKYDHNKITFSMAYFFSENFLLPLSHDEVVFGKGTILNKMNGDYNQKFAFVRNLYTYQMTHPGKKLNFMGNELASWDEWNENKSLPWDLKRYPKHDSVSRLCRDLNLIYKGEPALHFEEYNPVHFNWLMVDNNTDSIFAYERRVGGSILVCIFNMTPNYFEYFDIGVNKEGAYEEIFNSDKEVYGGNNLYNGDILNTSAYGPEGRPFKISPKIAPYAAMILKFKKN